MFFMKYIKYTNIYNLYQTKNTAFSLFFFLLEFLICNCDFHWDSYLQLIRKILAFIFKTASSYAYESEKTFELA